jgi:hypothetical protein
MITNDLFRVLSLRQPARSRREDPREPSPDPRLRLRSLLDGPSPARKDRASRLADLKTRQLAAAKDIEDLEAVQRAVVKVTMLDARSAFSARDLSAQVEPRLTARQKVLFRRAHVGMGDHVDVDDLIRGLTVDGVVGEANKLCTQISAIEEDLSEGLPTVANGSAAGGQPRMVAAGWGDLIVARESLVGYTAREIAHIENVMPGEKKFREHSRLSKSEQVQESETVTEKESEKDSQTTDRFELQAAAQETINQNFSVSAGVNVSAKYGVTQVNASLDTAFSQTSSQSRSSSLQTAREIVSKAVERTFERVRTLRRLTITEEIRELNRHQLTNASQLRHRSAACICGSRNSSGSSCATTGSG